MCGMHPDAWLNTGSTLCWEHSGSYILAKAPGPSPHPGSGAGPLAVLPKQDTAGHIGPKVGALLGGQSTSRPTYLSHFHPIGLGHD